ncbi:hypothetical protein [Salegentibacter echinorum]|uniref:hypothetical protein n=1 Tax=Salegentibacter echinorum TaxID=1073325 RepID=UPI001587692C|nr:hypothetical protein [Salegentibacter echinorum]
MRKIKWFLRVLWLVFYILAILSLCDIIVIKWYWLYAFGSIFLLIDFVPIIIALRKSR